MKFFFLITIVVLFVNSTAFSQQSLKTSDPQKVSFLLNGNGGSPYVNKDPDYNENTISKVGLEIPRISYDDQVISHTGYSFLYSDKDKQSRWVAYELTREETKKLYYRTDKFLTDPAVKSGTATDSDYAGSGYDRGHLAPAADMGWSSSTMAESFYYSNMSPQLPAFNRGIWKKLEELVRTWAIENEALYIVTGPVLTDGLRSIGQGKVSIPNYFYKVVLDYKNPDINGIGFIFPNAGSGEPLQYYAVSIDSVEKITGIDFYPLIPPDQQAQIEKTLCVNCWTWKTRKTDYKNNADEKASVPIRCKGFAESGDRCKNKTMDASGYCHLHIFQKRTKF